MFILGTVIRKKNIFCTDIRNLTLKIGQKMEDKIV